MSAKRLIIGFCIAVLALLQGTPGMYIQASSIQSGPVGVNRPLNLPTLQQTKLTAFDRASGDQFGASVAVSADGSTALVGATQDDEVPFANNGAAYVYIFSGGLWQFQAKLFASDKATQDLLGQSVALSADGNTAVVGAPNKSDSGLTSNGDIYVFVRSGIVWTQQAKLSLSDKATSDSAGYSVSIASDGNTVIAGVPGKSDSPLSSNGAAYIFTRSGTAWSQQAKLSASDKASNAGFGIAVAVSADGSTAVVGAYSQSESGFSSNGAAYTYTRSGSIWTQQAKLLASDKASSDLFGISVAISSDGNTALIGAYLHDDSPNSGNGAAYVFTRSGSVWTQQAKLLASDRANNDNLGRSVALSSDGNTALVGALFEDDPSATNNGAAYLFTRNAGVWSQQFKLLAADKSSDDYLGSAVALSGNASTAIIGAPNKTDSGFTNNGDVYLFTDPAPTATPSATFTSTSTLTPTNTITNTPTFTHTSTNTPTDTPSAIPTNTPTFTPTQTDTSTPTNTATATGTATNTPVPLRPDTIGVYKSGVFYLRNSNTSGSADIMTSFGGDPSDLPVAGDWNGDGIDTIGLYRSGSGTYFLSDSNTTPAVNYSLVFGNPGDTPFAGRWTPAMTHDGVGVYRNSNGVLFEKSNLTTGFSDFFAIFGNPGDKGIAGDWNGDGLDSIGIYRGANVSWFMTNNSQPNGVTFSQINYIWDIGSGRLPVTGDWDGNLTSTGGSYDPATGVFLLNTANSSPGSLYYALFGTSGGMPISGKWTASPVPPNALTIISGPVAGSGYHNLDTSGAD